MAAPTRHSSIFHNMWEGVKTGSAIMLAQTPLVTALNRTSVVSCFRNLPMLQAVRHIFQGKEDLPKGPSATHFFKGVSGHLMKETARLGFKASGLVLKPQIDHHFAGDPSGKLKSDLIFAGGLSVAEMAINPADTVRTMWQASGKLKEVEKGKLTAHLYKGSVANGLRQFGIWLGFPASERTWSKVVDETTSLDSHSVTGIAVKSFPQSAQITAPVWVFERVKNELQYHPEWDKTEKKSSRYLRAFHHITKTQGWRGLFRGFGSKTLSNAILVVGSDYLLEQGRKIRKDL